MVQRSKATNKIELFVSADCMQVSIRKCLRLTGKYKKHYVLDYGELPTNTTLGTFCTHIFKLLS